MIIASQSDKDYHATSHIGSTTAKLILKSRRLFYDRITGVDSVPDRPCFQMGRLAHMAILEPDRFEKMVCVTGPINEKTGLVYGRDTKVFQSWQSENPSLTVIDPWLATSIIRMPQEVADLLRSGIPEVSVYRELACGVNAKCRPDYLRGSEIYDLKTIDDIDQIDRAIFKYGYYFSAAWYRMVMREETGVDHNFTLIFMEKKSPFRWRIVTLDQAYTEYADTRVEDALTAIAECQDSGKWNDVADVRREVVMPSWLNAWEVDEDGGISL